jgi:hypothetical protein
MASNPRRRMFPDTVTNRLMTGMFAIIFAGVLMARVFAEIRTIAPSAGTRLGRISGRSVNRNNRPIKLSIPQRGGRHLIHSLNSLRPNIKVAYPIPRCSRDVYHRE